MKLTKQTVYLPVKSEDRVSLEVTCFHRKPMLDVTVTTKTHTKITIKCDFAK